jgi:hypothetical protein
MAPLHNTLQTLLEVVNHTLTKHPELIPHTEAMISRILNRPRLHAPPGHYFSPIVNPAELTSIAKTNSCPDNIPGIKLDIKLIEQKWQQLHPYLNQTPFPYEKSQSFNYYFNNPAYGIGDACIYFAMLNAHKPKRVVEIGSGFSSACLIDTANHCLNHLPEIIFIEPFPNLLRALVSIQDLKIAELYEQPVQQTEKTFFRKLQAGDFLFIDSTHVLKTGSDVNFNLFTVLPLLNSGVIIHFHDVFWPFEYPNQWIIEDNRSWNELYALRAFLMHNEDYEILFFNDFFAKNYKHRAVKEFPQFLDNPGGGLWLRKIGQSDV